jgi:hypothetical protein
LFACNVLPCHVRGPRRGQHGQDRKAHQKKKRKDTKSRDEVRASMKNLGHDRFLHFGGERTERALCEGVPRV